MVAKTFRTLVDLRPHLPFDPDSVSGELMTTQMLFEKLTPRHNISAGERRQRMLRHLTAMALAGVLFSGSAWAQSLYGTFTASGQSSGVPIALNLSVNGGQISGVMGTSQPGANPPVVNPASMVTRVQGTARGTQWVVQAGSFTMTGVFNGTTFSGSYRVGSQGGVFSLSTSAPVYRAPVAAAQARATETNAAGRLIPGRQHSVRVRYRTVPVLAPRQFSMWPT